MSTQHLFNRDWSVAIGPEGGKGKIYTGLKVTFDIDKNSVSSSNKSKIEIWNLGRGSRISFQKGYLIQLRAGYKGLVETLYTGNIMKIHSERKQADIVTTFECGDGEKSLMYSIFDQTYPPGTTVVQIIEDLATALGSDIGTVIGIQAKVFNSGISFSGSVKRSLDRLLAANVPKLEWHIQNGSLCILPVDAHNGDEAILISKETGMIGIPSQGQDCITFISLLNPKIQPGSPVKLQTETFNGFYKIRRTHFEGDSHGDKWQVSCETTKISAVQSLPQNAGLSFRTSVA